MVVNKYSTQNALFRFHCQTVKMERTVGLFKQELSGDMRDFAKTAAQIKTQVA